MPRANKPRGRADHQQHVDRVKEEAARCGLVELLEAVASDPDAGPWSAWAERMQAGDHADSAPATKTGEGA